MNYSRSHKLGKVPTKPLHASQISAVAEASFWSLVKFVFRQDACWEWTGGLVSKRGYARFKIEGERFTVSRIAYALAYGYVPEDKFVLHECDNPKCVRPDHLFLGSATENQHDMKIKGRAARGERSASAKLTTEQVLMIRRDPRPAPHVADELGIHKSTVRKIRTRVNWAHVA